MQELLSFGISHRTAPLAVRERLALNDTHATALLRDLHAQPEIDEAVAVSTCNRMELYVVATDPVEAEAVVLTRLSRRSGIRTTELVDSLYPLRNCDAARHLFRVCSGLDSMILGEAEIQGQVKRAYDLSLAAGTTGPMTNKLFRAALATGKRVRTETTISEGAASIPSLAVDAARARLGDLSTRRVLVLGAGETSELTARALAAHGVMTLWVANRRVDSARMLAERYGGRASSFDRLPDELVQADMVISSTGSPHAVLHADALEMVVELREGRPLLLLDLAVPRDIEPECGLLDGVTLFDVDALHAGVRAARTGREAEAARAEGIVEEEIASFAAWLAALEVLPTVAALREQGNTIVEQVLAENAGRWEGLTERDAKRVEAVARAVMQRLLHTPTDRIKRSEGDRRHGRLRLARELFGIEDASDDAPAEDAAVPSAEPAEVRSLSEHRSAASGSGSATR